MYTVNTIAQKKKKVIHFKKKNLKILALDSKVDDSFFHAIDSPFSVFIF